MNHVDEYCLYCCLKKNRSMYCNLCESTAQGKIVDEHPSYLPPQTILNGQYIVGRVLGHGGFGITYLGIEANLDRRVAIKEFMPRDLAARHAGTQAIIPYPHTKELFQQQINKFLQEARSLARFQGNPHVVSVQNFFRENNTGYLVMEYFDGQTLQDIREKNSSPLPVEQIISWITQVLQGLQTIHNAGILHRDIKPQNIYLTAENKIKLLDFGSAREMSSHHKLTQVWTPGFAPPEQKNGTESQQGPWTDIYAVGATLYTLLLAQDPPNPEEMTFQSSSTVVSEVSRSMLFNFLNQTQTINFSEKLINIIEKSTTFHITCRYQSASIMMQDIQHINQGYTENELNKHEKEQGYFAKIEGQRLFKKKQFAEAIHQFRSSIQDNDNDAEIYFYCGMCLFQLSRIEEAISEFEQALKLQPKNKIFKKYLKKSLHLKTNSVRLFSFLLTLFFVITLACLLIVLIHRTLNLFIIINFK